MSTSISKALIFSQIRGKVKPKEVIFSYIFKWVNPSLSPSSGNLPRAVGWKSFSTQSREGMLYYRLVWGHYFGIIDGTLHSDPVKNPTLLLNACTDVNKEEQAKPK
jgi:hypothetical protein